MTYCTYIKNLTTLIRRNYAKYNQGIKKKTFVANFFKFSDNSFLLKTSFVICLMLYKLIHFFCKNHYRCSVTIYVI